MTTTLVVVVLVVLHSIFILHRLFISTPPNIFTSLNIDISTPTESIRNALLLHVSPLPEHTESLLTRLRSFDARILYIRYGHDVLHCSYCYAPSDFALYALPRPLLQYLRTAAIVGLLTLHAQHKQRWRTPTICLLIAAAVTEAWWVTTAHITLERQGSTNHIIMWHDTLWTCRHILFLLLPPILLFLPASPASTSSSNPLSILPQALAALETTTTRLHLLKYTRGAIMRVPSLRLRSGAWWANEREEGAWVREDPGVQRVADRLGLGFTGASEKKEGNDDDDRKRGEGEGKLRVNAKMAVRSLMGGFVPSENWMR